MLAQKEKEQEYIATLEAMRKAHHDRLLILDLQDEGRVIAQRCRESERVPAKTVCEFMDRKMFQNMRAYTLAYQDLPLVVHTDLGTGIAIPHLAPSSSLVILSLPEMDRETVVRLAKSDLCGDFAFDELSNRVRRCLSKKTMEKFPVMDALMKDSRKEILG